MNIRTTIETYSETIEDEGETFHNVDELGDVTRSAEDVIQILHQLRAVGYRARAKRVNTYFLRYCIYTIPKLGEYASLHKYHTIDR